MPIFLYCVIGLMMAVPANAAEDAYPVSPAVSPSVSRLQPQAGSAQQAGGAQKLNPVQMKKNTEDAINAMNAVQSSLWDQSMIALLPMVIILITIVLLYAFKIRQDSKLGRRIIDNYANNQLIMERQRMMLEHLANIEKLLIDISHKLDKK